MEEIIRFLNECKTFFLATEEGDQARVRPLGFVMDYDGQLAFCTRKGKKMHSQMVASPKVEICGCMPDGKYVRVTGKVDFITCEAAQKKALEVMPMLSGLYKVGDDTFVIFAIKSGNAVFSDLQGNSREVSF